MTFEQIAAELLSGPPETFLARRKEAATGLGADLKLLVAKLPKPSVAAWALDAFARTQAGELDALLDTSHRLREAQADGHPAAMRTLTTEANDEVRRVLSAVADCAADAGVALGDTTLAQVEQTLRAAMSDPIAGDAVRAGLLLKPLSPAGFGTVELAGLVAGTAPARPVPARRPDLKLVPTGSEVPESTTGPRAGRAEVEAAKAELIEARRLQREHDKAVQQRERALATAQDQRDRAADALAQADQRLEDQQVALAEAQRAADVATERVEAARTALSALEP